MKVSVTGPVSVSVVGAGVVGCAIAYELARRGARVRVIDPRAPGQGATHAAAGILAPYIEGHVSALLKLGVRSLALYDDFVQQLRVDSGRDVEYSRCGTLQVAAADVDVTRLAARARELSDVRVVHRLFDGAGLRDVEPALSPQLQSGLLIPAHGYVAASSLTEALVAAATGLGVAFECATVTEVGSLAGGACVHTSTGRIECDVAVMAAGSWSPTIAIKGHERGHLVPIAAEPPVRPVRGQLLRLMTATPVVTHVVWGPGCYIVPWEDGTVLVGATVENAGFDDRPTAGGVRGLLNAAISLFPALEGAVFGGVRVGLRPATDDDVPVVGRSSTLPHLFYATGHFRNGVLLAPLTASLVADALLDGGDGPGMELMRPGRFGL